MLVASFLGSEAFVLVSLGVLSMYVGFCAVIHWCFNVYLCDCISIRCTNGDKVSDFDLGVGYISNILDILSLVQCEM